MQKVLNDIAVERNARNAHRQRDFELKQLARLVKEDSSINQDMIEEKEVIIKDLNVIIDNKGSVTPACENCTKCEDEKEICNCFCNTCEKVTFTVDISKIISQRAAEQKLIYQI